MCLGGCLFSAVGDGCHRFGAGPSDHGVLRVLFVGSPLLPPFSAVFPFLLVLFSSFALIGFVLCLWSYLPSPRFLCRFHVLAVDRFACLLLFFGLASYEILSTRRSRTF